MGEAVNDELLREFLEKNLYGYILPMLGESQENLDFAKAVLDRFSNPYIRHMWKAISLNSVSKFTVRVLPTMTDWHNLHGEWPKSLVFSLACLIKYYKEQDVSDDLSSAAFIRENGVVEILADRNLWGVDLSECAGLIEESLTRLEKDVREAVRWAIS